MAKLMCGLIIIMLGGCSSLPTQKVVHFPGQVRLLEKSDKKLIYPQEAAFEDNELSESELGISFSGGGMRSASFTMGAMAGLTDNGILQQADYISTVSGGGYTGYWLLSNLYYAQLENTDVVYENLFNDCYPNDWPLYEHSSNYYYVNCAQNGGRKHANFRFQHQVVQQSDLLNYYQDTDRNADDYWSKKFRQWGEVSGIMTTQLVSTIPHHLGNSLFDWGWNVSALKRSYQNGIERAFGLVPVDLTPSHIDDKTYLNAKSFLWMDNYEAQSISFTELAAATTTSLNNCSKARSIAGECNRFPIWVINSTAGVADRIYEWLDSAPSLTDSVFEFTPFSYGSNKYGYAQQPFTEFDIAKAVAVSGAAMDTQFTSEEMTGGKRTAIAAALHLVNFDLGESITNYNPARSNVNVHNFLPWPFYYLQGFNRNKASTDIYLSDGGHSENLGAYSLIVRGIKNVIIIDSEHDPKGRWHAIKSLATKLKTEHGLTLSLDKIDNLQDFEMHPNKAHESIFSGQVHGYKAGYGGKDGTINILYVKASIIKDYVSDSCDDERAYPCSATRFYKKNYLTTDCTFAEKKNSYPNHSTFKTAANMSVDIYYAYRDLARYITNRISFNNGELSFNKLPSIGGLAGVTNCG